MNNDIGSTWRHAILEIYEPKSGWPKEGTPSEWVDKKLVGWCDGDIENVIVLCPLYKILWWKLKFYAIGVYWWVLYYTWDWWHKSEWEELFSTTLDKGEREDGNETR